MSPLVTTVTAVLVATVMLAWVGAVAFVWALLRAEGKRNAEERERIEHYRGEGGGD